MHGNPGHPRELTQYPGIVIRSPQTGRVRSFNLSNESGATTPLALAERIIFDEPDAASHAAMRGFGIALVPTQNALPYIEKGLLRRMLPDWWVDGGDIAIYFAAQKLLPKKTRVFVEHVVETFRREHLAERFSALHPALR